MTAPIAEAAVELVADASRFPRSVKRALDGSEPEVRRSGRDAGGEWAQAFRIGIANRIAGTGLRTVLAPLRAGIRALGFSVLAASVASSAAALVSFTAAVAPALGIVAAGPAVLAAFGAAAGTLAVALSGVGDAFGAALESDPQKFAEELEGLSPAARSVAREFRALVPLLNDVKTGVQDAFFAPLAGQLSGIAANLAGPMARGMRQVADAAGRAAARIGDLAQESATARIAERVFGSTSRAIDRLAPGITEIVRGFRDLAGAALPAVDRLAVRFGDIASSFGRWLQDVSRSGRALEWINNAVATLRTLGRLFSAVGGIIGSVTQAANTAGGNLLDTLTGLAERADEFLSSAEGQTALVRIFESLQRVGAALAPVFQRILLAVGQLAPHVADIAVALGPGLAAAIGAVSAALDGLAPGLVAVSEGLSAAFADPEFRQAVIDLGAALGELLTALSPMLPVLADLAASLSGGLAGGLRLVASVIGPVLSGIADLNESLGGIPASAAAAGAAFLLLNRRIRRLSGGSAGVTAFSRSVGRDLDRAGRAIDSRSQSFGRRFSRGLGTAIRRFPIAGAVAALLNEVVQVTDKATGEAVGIVEAVPLALGRAFDAITGDLKGEVIEGTAVLSDELASASRSGQQSLAQLGGAARGLGSDIIDLGFISFRAFGQLRSSVASGLSGFTSSIAQGLGQARNAFAVGAGAMVNTNRSLWSRLVSDAQTSSSRLSGIARGAALGMSAGIGAGLAGAAATSSSWWSRIVGQTQADSSRLPPIARGAADGAAASVGAGLGRMSSRNARTWDEMVNATRHGADRALSLARGLGGRLQGVLSGVTLASQGRAIMSSLAAGLEAGASNVIGIAAGLASRIAAVKGPIEYDRRLLIPHGRAIMHGLARGLEYGIPGVERTLHRLTHRIPAMPSPPGAGGYRGVSALPSPAGAWSRGGSSTTHHRQVEVHAPITVQPAAANPLLVARRVADRVAVLAQT